MPEAYGSGLKQFRAGVAQLVELLPSKQNVASSSLVSRSIVVVHRCPESRSPSFDPSVFAVSSGLCGAPAQTSVDCPCGSVVEHSLGKGEVARSIRAMGTKGFGAKSRSLKGLQDKPAVLSE